MVANPAPRVVTPPGEVVYRSWRSPLLLVHTSWRLTYARRQLFELIQNGADALSGTGGGRIWIGLTSSYLYCADEGQPIDQDGVRALMFAYLSPSGVPTR